MKLKRLFSSSFAKGTENYLNTQKKYEILRTILYFSVSASLFIAGYLQTKTKVNLLTVVAVLGCLPASKSLVSAIMFFRYKSCDRETVEEILPHTKDLVSGFDFVFTAKEAVYVIPHLAVRGKSICAYAGEGEFAEAAFLQHLKEHLALDGEKDVSVKVFHKLSTYVNRLDQMGTTAEDREQSERILATMKSITL